MYNLTIILVFFEFFYFSSMIFSLSLSFTFLLLILFLQHLIRSIGVQRLAQNPSKVPMMDRGNRNGRIASSSGEQANLAIKEFLPSTLEDMSIDVSDEEIHEIAVEKGRNNDGVAEDNAVQHENDQLFEHPANDNPRKRRCYYRHTQYQIKAMDTYYRICPHPDESQRREMAQELGLHPLQVKFWFQNKRTQIKTHHTHVENAQLRAENKNLCCENMKLKENVSFCSCQRCGGYVVMMADDKHQLRLENERLKKEIEHITAMAESVVGNIVKTVPAPSSSSTLLSSFNLNPLQPGIGTFGSRLENIPFGDTSRMRQLFRPLNSASEIKKTMVIELAISAIQEVDAMARIGEPLWTPDLDRNNFVLNPQEYLRIFQRTFPPKPPGFRSESSRACAVVTRSPIEVIEIFMQLNKWLSVFSGIISKAIPLEVLSAGVGYYDGALQLMAMKFQALSPAIPSRECIFARYCKQLSETTWGIVDVSVDALFTKGPIARCQRKPSGCLIQAMPNNCSKITWVEHVEVQDCYIHSLSRSIISSGNAYGAKRWVSVLERQCERLASAEGLKDFPYFEDLNEIVLAHPEGKKSILKLAERMILSFYGGVTASPRNHLWTTVSGNAVDDVRIMTRRSMNDFGCPNGVVISASISSWIPVLPEIVFNYLRHERTRAEWDILSERGGVHEMAYIGTGQERINRVSMLRVNNPFTNEGSMMILQECSSEPTSSLIVYAPVDVVSINKLLGGGNPNLVQILPSGFTILPSGPPVSGHEGRVDNDGTKGTLLTIAFQILGDSTSNLMLSVESIATVKNLVKSTIRKIQSGLLAKNYNVYI